MHASDGNGGEKMELRFGRWSWFKLIGGMVGIAIAAFGAASYLFMTRADAKTEHTAINESAMEQRHELEKQKLIASFHEKTQTKTEKQVAEALEKLSNAVTAVGAVAKTVDANQRVIMNTLEIEKRNRHRLPAGLKFKIPKKP